MVRKIPKKYLKYLDKNNLYCYSMAKFYLWSRFKSLYPAKLNLNKCDNDSFLGCILEVTLENPEELHKLQNDHLLALKVQTKMLSGYQLNLLMTIIFLLLMLKN